MIREATEEEQEAAEPPCHHEAAASPDASRTWRRGARTLCTQVAHTALFSLGLWWGKLRVGARVPLQVVVASTMYAAVVAISRALPCHTAHCRLRTAAAVMLATSVVVSPCVAAVMGLAVATVLPRRFLWWPKKAAAVKAEPLEEEAPASSRLRVTSAWLETLLRELQAWKAENSGAFPGEGSALLQKIRDLRKRTAQGTALEASRKAEFEAAMPGIWGDFRAVKVEQDATGGSQTTTPMERLCQDLQEHLEKNDGFYPGTGPEVSPEERRLRVRLSRLKRESLSEEVQAQFNALRGWSWVAAERPKRPRPETQEPQTAQEAQEVQEAREAQDAQEAQQPTGPHSIPQQPGGVAASSSAAAG